MRMWGVVWHWWNFLVILCWPENAPMCWVMPPCSDWTTQVSRRLSRSVVFPWSTWPMIVTTGGRRTNFSSSAGGLKGFNNKMIMFYFTWFQRDYSSRLGPRESQGNLHYLTASYRNRFINTMDWRSLNKTDKERQLSRQTTLLWEADGINCHATFWRHPCFLSPAPPSLDCPLSWISGQPASLSLGPHVSWWLGH